MISARSGTFFLFLSVLHQNKALHNFGTRGQCSIVKCNIGLEYALTYFVLSIRTIIAASFTSLNLLSTFHIRFLKNNSVFSKFLFFLQCLALAGGLNLLPNFQKGGLDRTSTLTGGVTGKERVTFN